MAVKKSSKQADTGVYIPVEVVQEPGKPGRYDCQIVEVLDKPKSLGVRWNTPIGPAHSWFTKGTEVGGRIIGEMLACLIPNKDELNAFVKNGKVNVVGALAFAVANERKLSAYVDYDEYEGRRYRRARLFRPLEEGK